MLCASIYAVLQAQSQICWPVSWQARSRAEQCFVGPLPLQLSRHRTCFHQHVSCCDPLTAFCKELNNNAALVCDVEGALRTAIC